MATKKKAQGLAGLARNMKAQARRTASDVAKIAAETPQRILGELQKGLAGSRDTVAKAATTDIGRAARALKRDVDDAATVARAGVAKAAGESVTRTPRKAKRKAKTRATTTRAKARVKTRVTKAKTQARKAKTRAKTRVTKARKKTARANGGARTANVRRAPKKTARKG